MRLKSRVDENQPTIVKALRRAGCSVQILSAVGEGCPDLLVTRPYYPHHTMLMEIKDGKKPPSARELTPAQIKFHREWKGVIHVVTSEDEALEAAGVVRILPSETT